MFCEKYDEWVLSLTNHRFLVHIQMLQGNPRSLCHTIERILGQNGFHSRTSKNKLGEVSKLGCASRHNYPLIYDVTRQLWWRFLQNIFYGFYHLAQVLAYSLYHFVCFYLKASRKSRNKIATFYHYGKLFVEGNG